MWGSWLRWAVTTLYNDLSTLTCRWSEHMLESLQAHFCKYDGDPLMATNGSLFSGGCKKFWSSFLSLNQSPISTCTSYKYWLFCTHVNWWLCSESSYCIAGKFGEVFNLVIWWSRRKSRNLNSTSIKPCSAGRLVIVLQEIYLYTLQRMQCRVLLSLREGISCRWWVYEAYSEPLPQDVKVWHR